MAARNELAMILKLKANLKCASSDSPISRPKVYGITGCISIIYVCLIILKEKMLRNFVKVGIDLYLSHFSSAS